MTLLANEMRSLGAVLLPIAAGLLFEELTFGGLVRLLLAPWPVTKTQAHSAGELLPQERKREKNRKGEEK